MSISKAIGRALYRWQVNKAVRQAKKYSDLFDKKYMAVHFMGRPRAVSKQRIKQLLSMGYFKKGTTMQKLEKTAFYVSK